MAQTYIGSTLRAGSGTLTDTVDGGYTVLTQLVSVTTVAAGTAVSGSVTLPASSQILSFNIDQTVDEVVGGGTATAINATIGTAAAGTQYLSATNVVSGGRASLTFTAAQLLAMQNIGTNTGVYFTIAPNGTISTTQGTYVLTVVYAQKV
jgi:hypothetical protein